MCFEEAQLVHFHNKTKNMIEITFNTPINTSLQIKDLAYFVTPTPVAGFSQSTLEPELIGPVETISETTISVDDSEGTQPSENDFIMFRKSNIVNNSTIVGEYAEVKLSNNSSTKAELFTVGSEITASSK
jgi:hypothetical protein